MIIQLLVFTFACAVSATDDLPILTLGNDVRSIHQAIDILQKKIISMDGNIPSVNDPRRQYAVIVHVVHDQARAVLCPRNDYYGDYQHHVNKSLPFAVANPQKVIHATQKLIDDVLKAVNETQEDVDSVLDSETEENLEDHVHHFRNSRKAVRAASLAATQIIQADKQFFTPSTNLLSAHNFVITSPDHLEKVVMAVKNLYVILYNIVGCS